MANQKHNWDSEWAGLEPGSTRSWGCWLGLVLFLFVVLVACLITVFLAWQWLDLPQQPGSLLTPPTVVSGVEATTESRGESSISNTPSLAPTVTLASQSINGNVEAIRLSFEPLLDGDLQEWDALPAYDSRYRVYQAAGWDGTEDLVASWHVGWTADVLYVAVTVEDDIHVQTQTGNQIFRGDSVSLQIDTNRESDSGPGLSPDDFQINLSPGDFASIPPSAFRFQGNQSGGSSDAPGHNIKLSAAQTTEGYTLEAAIPWQDLNIIPSPGLVIGLALNANDNDTPGTAVQEMMKSHVVTRTFGDPTSWGTLTLR